MHRRRSIGRHYGPGFFAHHADDSGRSARAVVEFVADIVEPKSVLDIGCGVGHWLAEWREHGIHDFLGVDGNYVDRQVLEIPEEHFRAADLTQNLDLERRFDIVQCLEVAEHIDKSASNVLVETITRHGDTVLFSAAVPGQGGTHHVNEQWPSFWAPKFEARGFEVFDVLRPRFWADANVAVWYRQNLMLFARGAAAEQLNAQELMRLPLLDVVHPELFATRSQNSSFARLLAKRMLPLAVRRSINEAVSRRQAGELR